MKRLFRVFLISALGRTNCTAMPIWENDLIRSTLPVWQNRQARRLAKTLKVNFIVSDDVPAKMEGLTGLSAITTLNVQTLNVVETTSKITIQYHVPFSFLGPHYLSTQRLHRWVHSAKYLQTLY
ncbi:MAG: hypothetical protein P8M80_04245 [Pirellulaceae bacterium]|nr:hypothetical protein [Pirellulaceae bacterium]